MHLLQKGDIMNVTRSIFLTGVGAVAASTMSEPAAAQIHPASAAITAALETFGEALKRGDGVAAASIFASDATVVVPGSFIRGRDAIAAFYTDSLKSTKFLAASFSTISVTGNGDIAVEIGTNRLTLADSGKPPETVLGRYLTVWRKGSDGLWRVAADASIDDPAAPS
jgi:uncharacterized protein (TIGR02246 family)